MTAQPTTGSPGGALLVALWPLGVLGLSLGGRAAFGEGPLVEASLAAGLLLPVVFLLWRARRMRVPWHHLVAPLNRWPFALLVLVWTIGALVGPLPARALHYVALTIAAFIIAAAYVQLFSAKDLLRGLGLFSVGATLLLIYVDAVAGGPGRTLRGFRLNVNAVGFFAMTAGSFALCIRRPLLRWLTVAAASVPIFSLNSRSSLLGLAVTVAAYSVLGTTRSSYRSAQAGRPLPRAGVGLQRPHGALGDSLEPLHSLPGLGGRLQVSPASREC